MILLNKIRKLNNIWIFYTYTKVDQRGFPERNSVTGIMIENIQDPELRDFVEESITECFHYLRSDLNQDKCRFSQNLLSCLADKGSEVCLEICFYFYKIVRNLLGSNLVLKCNPTSTEDVQKALKQGRFL